MLKASRSAVESLVNEVYDHNNNYCADSSVCRLCCCILPYAHAQGIIFMSNAPINVLPQVYTTPRAMGGDLIHMKSIPSPLGLMLISNAPIRTVCFCVLSVNIDQIPLIRGTFIGQNMIKPPPFASRG